MLSDEPAPDQGEGLSGLLPPSFNESDTATIVNNIKSLYEPGNTDFKTQLGMGQIKALFYIKTLRHLLAEGREDSALVLLDDHLCELYKAHMVSYKREGRKEAERMITGIMRVMGIPQPQSQAQPGPLGK